MCQGLARVYLVGSAEEHPTERQGLTDAILAGEPLFLVKVRFSRSLASLKTLIKRQAPYQRQLVEGKVGDMRPNASRYLS